MRKASKVVAEILREMEASIRPGVTTRELDRIAEDLTKKKGAKPAFKGYRDYPCTLCASVNEQVVHGIPNEKPLREGDIVGIYCGAIVEGFYGDAAMTFPVGRIDSESERLLRVTREALKKGIAQIREGNRVHDISWAVQEHAERVGFSVVRDFVGHGVGRALHEEPQIPNFGTPHTGPRLAVGMVLAIEPMINMGGAEVRVLEDGWTVVTVDGKRSAHFEHTVALTSRGPEILSAL